MACSLLTTTNGQAQAGAEAQHSDSSRLSQSNRTIRVHRRFKPIHCPGRVHGSLLPSWSRFVIYSRIVNKYRQGKGFRSLIRSSRSDGEPFLNRMEPSVRCNHAWRKCSGTRLELVSTYADPNRKCGKCIAIAACERSDAK